MANQTGKNLYVAYKVEATLNTTPAAGDAEVMRLSASPGLGISMPTILPTEIRKDMLTVMGRLGSRSVSGSFTGDLSVNSWDTLLQAAMRSTWATLVEIDDSDSSASVTVTAAGINGSATADFIAEGVKVGDVFRITGLAATADTGRNLRVKSVASAAIGVVETLTAEATAVTTYTITLARKLTNAATPTRRSFHLEQYYQDIDQSLLFGGCRVGGFTLRGEPDGMASIEVRMAGMSQEVKATGDSPVFTTPTEYATDPLVFVDAKIAKGGTDIATATSFELVGELGGQTLPVIGSTVSPDVFDNEFVVNGSLSLLRTDLDNLEALDAETEYELHILLEEPSGTPAKCFSLFLPRVKFSGVTAALGQDGAMIETIPFMVGLKDTTTGYDKTMLKVSEFLT